MMGLMAATATAQNIVQNGSFSGGTLAPWTQTQWGVGTFPPTDGGAQPAGTTFAAALECTGAGCNDPTTGATLKQTLATTPGQTYTLTFAYDAGAHSGIETTILQVYWNGALVSGGAITNAAASTWGQYSFSVTATGASTVLEFTGRQDPGAALYLTNISVDPQPSFSPIPGTLLLELLGMGSVLAYLAWRRMSRQF